MSCISFASHNHEGPILSWTQRVQCLLVAGTRTSLRESKSSSVYKPDTWQSFYCLGRNIAFSSVILYLLCVSVADCCDFVALCNVYVLLIVSTFVRIWYEDRNRLIEGTCWTGLMQKWMNTLSDVNSGYVFVMDLCTMLGIDSIICNTWRFIVVYVNHHGGYLKLPFTVELPKIASLSHSAGKHLNLHILLTLWIYTWGMVAIRRSQSVKKTLWSRKRYATTATSSYRMRVSYAMIYFVTFEIGGFCVGISDL